MPLRRTYESHCPECGLLNIGRIEGNQIWLNRNCTCQQPPGPPSPPRMVLLRDVVWPGHPHERIFDLESRLAEARKDTRLLEEENSEVKDACAEWTAFAQRLREALKLLCRDQKSRKYGLEEKIYTYTLNDADKAIVDKALDGDGGQEKK